MWDPAQVRDEFREQVMALVEEKAKAGKVSVVNKPGEDALPAGAEIVDLTEMLKRSLKPKAGATKSSPSPKPKTAKATVSTLPTKRAKRA